MIIISSSYILTMRVLLFWPSFGNVVNQRKYTQNVTSYVDVWCTDSYVKVPVGMLSGNSLLAMKAVKCWGFPVPNTHWHDIKIIDIGSNMKHRMYNIHRKYFRIISTNIRIESEINENPIGAICRGKIYYIEIVQSNNASFGRCLLQR